MAENEAHFLPVFPVSVTFNNNIKKDFYFNVLIFRRKREKYINSTNIHFLCARFKTLRIWK